MWRFLAGVSSALLMVTVGILWWTGSAQKESDIPPAPQARAATHVKQASELPAASEKSREERRFARYDKDVNGSITRAEMMDTRRKAFEKLDANHDTKLTFEEWAVATSDRFAKADADRSGALTAEEFVTTRRETRPEARCSC